MKNSLFIAAVVLFCTQVLDAKPCTTCKNGGTKTVTTTHSFTPVTYTTTSFNSGNKFGTNVNSGQTVTKFQTSSSNSDAETLQNHFNFGKNGKTVTVSNWSAGGKGDNDNDSWKTHAETLENIFNFGGGKGGNDNDNNDQRGNGGCGCKTCQGNGNNNGKTVAVSNWSAGGKGDNDNDSWKTHAETLENIFNFGGGKGDNDNDNNDQRGNGGCGCKTCQGNGNNNGNDDCKSKLEAEKAKNLNLQREIESLKRQRSEQEKKLTQVNLQWNTCNTKCDELTIQVNQLTQININLKIEIQQSQTTIINLTNNAQKMTIVNKGNEKTLIELKHNYDILIVKSENCQKKLIELTSSNKNLEQKYQEVSITLNQCKSSNSELSAKYLAQQQSSQTIQLNNSNCEGELEKCKLALKIAVDTYNKDEIDDVLREMDLSTTLLQLKACEKDRVSLQERVATEQANSAKCQDEKISIEIKFETIITNLETNIYNLKITANKLEESLQAEEDSKNTCILAKEKCELDNIDNTKIVEQLQKAVDDAASQIGSCRGDLDNYKNDFSALQITSTQKLANCDNVASTMELDLATCKANLANSSDELTSAEDRFTKVKNENIQLGDQYTLVENLLQNCEREAEKLRCTANKGLWKFEQSNDSVREILQRSIDKINNLKDEREKFIAGNETPCLYA